MAGKASKALTRQDVLEAKDARLVRVEVPEWGGHVFVFGWTGDQRDAWEARQYARSQAQAADRLKRGQLAQELAAKGQPIPPGLVMSEEEESAQALKGMRASLVAECTGDASGARLFTEADVKALGQKSAKALTRVWEVATKLNGIGAAEEAELLQG